jgi:hypothetical protein
MAAVGTDGPFMPVTLTRNASPCRIILGEISRRKVFAKASSVEKKTKNAVRIERTLYRGFIDLNNFCAISGCLRLLRQEEL